MSGQSQCVFCDLIAKRPRHVRFVGDCAVFQPLNPVTPGHMLVVPTTHARNAAEAPGLAGDAFETAADVLRQQGGHANLITSVGEHATQTVGHLHVHLVPRRDGDGLSLPWTGQQAVVS